jgi:hypothetical protein
MEGFNLFISITDADVLWTAKLRFDVYQLTKIVLSIFKANRQIKRNKNHEIEEIKRNKNHEIEEIKRNKNHKFEITFSALLCNLGISNRISR